MLEFIQLSGPWGIILAVLFLLNLGLVVWTVASLFGSGEGPTPVLGNRINAILFWGAFGAAVGILGQANGIYLGLRAISSARSISPQVTFEGLAISFLPTIAGFVLLLGSAIAWMALRTAYRRMTPEVAPV